MQSAYFGFPFHHGVRGKNVLRIQGPARCWNMQQPSNTQSGCCSYSAYAFSMAYGKGRSTYSRPSTLPEYAAALTLIRRTANQRIKVRVSRLNTQSGCSSYSGFAFPMGYEERAFCAFKFWCVAGTCSNPNLNTQNGQSAY